ncbi:MAG: rod shape-determining protein RodA [Myxococcales bacterium]|nr:rod shape-determining protein RodA [Myxococcales bacterium]
MMELSGERRSVAQLPWLLLAMTALTTAVGIYNLASASRPPSAPMWASQIAYFFIGSAIAVVVAWIDPKLLERLAIPIYLFNLGALVALKFFGHKAKGAESWFVVGPIRVQPAEFMKLGMLLMMAKYFHDDHRPQQPTYGFLRLIPPAVIALVPTALVLVQPDLGTALMMAFTTITVLLFARPSLPVLIVLGVMAVAGAGVLWNDYLRPQNTEERFTIIRHKLKKHQDARITGWLDPTSDLKGSNYHAMQSKIAVGSGGMSGKGWMEGTQTGLRYLPEQHTDINISVIAEEQGYLKCLGLMVLYAGLLLAALGVAAGAKDRFGAFVAVGIAAMIFWQVFENIGMVTGLLPITGITLPLLSYGGSSMVSVLIGIGLLVNVSMKRQRSGL